MSQARMDPRTKRRLSAARRVRDLLRAAIVHEEFPAGALPCEAEPMRSFSASRQVIRDALALLREEGLSNGCPGTGTFAVASKVWHPFGHPHGPEPALERVSHRILAISREIAAPRVADRLGLDPGAGTSLTRHGAVAPIVFDALANTLILTLAAGALAIVLRIGVDRLLGTSPLGRRT